MLKFGIIAEDISDYISICVLIKRIAMVDRITTSKKLGAGKGKINRKYVSWCEELLKDGCHVVVILIDQDREIASDIETKINSAIKNLRGRYIVCVPVEEIEAWVLADINALREVFEIKESIKEVRSPEMQTSPKEMIEKIIKKATGNRKMYVKTSHNPKIFENIDLCKLGNCQQFVKFKNEIIALGKIA